MKNFKTVLLISLLLTLGCKKDKDLPTPSPTTTTAVACQQGFTGSNCQTQITPSKIIVTKIVVTKFPQYVYGTTNWDSNNGDYGDYRPDLYIDLISGTTSLLNPTAFYQDANYFQSYTFDNSPDFPFDIWSPELAVTIKAIDFDVATDDLLGGITFTPYYNTNGFPSIIYKNGTYVGFEIYVTYVW